MTYSGIKCGRLRSFHRILKEWINVNRLYCERKSWKDCAWWNNERALTGILAAAVWRINEVSLEEFVTTKSKKKESGSGRCDLLINTGKMEFACEVKQIFLTPKNRGDSVLSSINDCFKWACDDAKNLKPNEGRPLGICFVTPRFPSSLSIKRKRECIENLISDLKGLESKPDAMAWYFPHRALNLEWRQKLKWRQLKRTYPGVIILIREVEH